jgi:HPt (histidine-containing phosphotransfer) domain-containing protein
MSETLIDLEAWEVMKSMTDSAFLIDLIDVYLNDSPELIKQMRAGLSAGDIELVRRASHSLKSNSASFGANHLADAARQMEMAAKGGTLEGAGTMLEAIEVEYARLLPRLMELKNEC